MNKFAFLTSTLLKEWPKVATVVPTGVDLLKGSNSPLPKPDVNSAFTKAPGVERGTATGAIAQTTPKEVTKSPGQISTAGVMS